MKTNKEVIDKLTEYFLEQDPKIVARSLANMMIDLNRIRNFRELCPDDIYCLSDRINKNLDSLHRFIDNDGIATPMILNEINQEE
jgi:hypothetical protein